MLLCVARHKQKPQCLSGAFGLHLEAEGWKRIPGVCPVSIPTQGAWIPLVASCVPRQFPQASRGLDWRQVLTVLLCTSANHWLLPPASRLSWASFVKDKPVFWREQSLSSKGCRQGPGGCWGQSEGEPVCMRQGPFPD